MTTTNPNSLETATNATVGGRVAVTGGLGFVGAHLVADLVSAGREVVVLDVAASTETANGQVVYRQVDLRDPAATAAALEGVDLVFHIAGNSSGTRSVVEPRFDFETNAAVTFNVCEAALEARTRRLIYMSSAMVYGRPVQTPMTEDHPLAPFLPYGASKLTGEHIVSTFHHTFGLDVAIGRAFVIYGPGENPKQAGGEVSQYLRWHLNSLPVQATGVIDEKTRDFVHISDVVQALQLLAARGAAGEAYNIGAGEEYSLRQLADTIGNATSRPVELIEDDSVTDDTYRLVADIGKLRALGYVPRYSLADGVAALAEYLGPNPELPAVDTIFKPEQRGDIDSSQQPVVVPS